MGIMYNSKVQGLNKDLPNKLFNQPFMQFALSMAEIHNITPEEAIGWVRDNKDNLLGGYKKSYLKGKVSPEEEQFIFNDQSEIKFSSENQALQHLADLTGKRIKVAEEISAINEMSKQRAKTYVNKLMGKHSKGIFSDEYWSPVQNIFKDLSEANIDYVVGKTEYKKDDKGVPTSKRWTLTISFIDKNGKEQKLTALIIASGAGSVEDPLDKYDIVAYAN